MSYYTTNNFNNSFGTRGRGTRFSPRGSFRGRGGSRGGNNYSPRGNFHSSRPSQDEYRRSFSNTVDNYQSRDYRSPERKRMRNEEPNNYGGGFSHYDSYAEHSRSYSNDRHSGGNVTRRSEYRRPFGASASPRGGGGFRGRLSTRARSVRPRESIRGRLSDAFAKRKSIYRSASRTLNKQISRSPVGTRVVKPDKPKKAKVPSAAKEAKKDEADDDDEKKSKFIKLVCPVCNTKHITFAQYEVHLNSRYHSLQMRRLSLKHKSIVGQMRQAQRFTQNELEKSCENLQDDTNFCMLCQLNHRQTVAEHEDSEAHKNMKKVMRPKCKICNVSFKMPMAYESHCCKIIHLKKKHSYVAPEQSGGEDEDLANFTTIDSVGEGEDVKEKNEEKEEESVDLGEDQVNKVEVFYCDLCKMYLLRGEDAEMPTIINKHCKLRTHRQRYNRFKIAERKKDLKQKEEEEKKEKERVDKENEIKQEKETVVKEEENEESDAKEIWTDVEQDIGDVIAEAEKDYDEDEEESTVNGKRFDRFKQSEGVDAEEPKQDSENVTETPSQET